jgi:hypothetical protein
LPPATTQFLFISNEMQAGQEQHVDILNTRSNAWGQQVLEGVNLELVSLFVVAGIVLIVGHALVAAWLHRRRLKNGGDR